MRRSGSARALLGIILRIPLSGQLVGTVLEEETSRTLQMTSPVGDTMLTVQKEDQGTLQMTSQQRVKSTANYHDFKQQH